MKFELILAIKSEDKIDRFEKIGADDLVQLVSMFSLIVVQVQRDLHDGALAHINNNKLENLRNCNALTEDDSIPF